MKGGKKARDKILSRIEFESEPLANTLSTHATRFNATQLFAPSAKNSPLFFSYDPVVPWATKLSILARVLWRQKTLEPLDLPAAPLRFAWWGYNLIIVPFIGKKT